MSKKELLTAAEPYIRNLYEMILGSSSYICITDENGVVLSSFHDLGQVQFSEETFPFPGKVINEMTTGTNAIATCLYLDKPFGVFGEEHYKVSSHAVSCFSAPIHNEEQQIIGLINVSTLCGESDLKMLALIIAMAGSIEREMQLRVANHKIIAHNTLLETTLNSFSEGALLLDKNNIVIQTNNTAIRTLGLPKKQIINRRIHDIISINRQWEQYLAERRGVEDQEIRYYKDNKLIHVIASIYPCENSADIVSHKVIVLKKMQDVKKLINKMTSSSANFTFSSIIHKSEKMKNVVILAKRAASSDSTVLLLGESGTGKEMFAQAIHNASDRAQHPFIAINCGALPRELVESELFGYEGGAFTGSQKNGHLGKFELAEGGTIFLDEIGDMPLELQMTLLRVLQNKEVTRIGGKTSKQVNVRIIAATNCDLEEKIRNRSFRGDLYYRLNVLAIRIPSLRERPSDIEQLACHLTKKHCAHLQAEYLGISPDALEALRNYSWPGNVRELENVIERAVNINPSAVLGVHDLPPTLVPTAPVLSDMEKSGDPFMTATGASYVKDLPQSVYLEYENLINALTRTRGNVKDAAAILDVSYRSIYRRIEKYNIDKNSFKIHADY